MPKVGSEEFSYDEKGKKAAAAKAKKTGKPVVSKKGKKSKTPVMDRIKKGKGKAASGPAAGAIGGAMPAPPLGAGMGLGLDPEMLAGGLGSAGAAGALGSAGAGLGGVGPAMEPMPRKKPRMGYKHGGVVYSDARGAGAATRGTRYRS